MKIENLLNRMNRKLGRYAISNLMTYVVGGMAVVFIMDQFIRPASGASLSMLLSFDRAAILSGQVWRVLTFALVPPSSGMLFTLLALYLFWLIGNGLENHWGAFRFNVFYFFGILTTMLAGLLTGYATNYYLNLSMFLAFAMIYPDFQLMLFFVLPIKIKYLAILDALALLWMLITASWPAKIALLVSLANILLFFGGQFWDRLKNIYRRHQYRKNFK